MWYLIYIRSKDKFDLVTQEQYLNMELAEIVCNMTDAQKELFALFINQI
jgi:hypothetical protein